jgi:hypothetical protein
MALLREHGDLIPGDDATDRVGRQTIGSRIDAGQPCLDDPVGLADRHTVYRCEALHDRRRDRRAGRQRQPDGVEPTRRDEAAHAFEVERGRIEHTRAQSLDRLDDASREGVGAQQDVGAGPHVGDDRDREVIGQRQHPENAVLFVEAQHPIGGLDASRGRLVGQHDALAGGRRPRGEADEGRVEATEGVRTFHPASDPLEREPVAFPTRESHGSRGSRERVGPGPGQTAVHRHVPDDLLDFRWRVVGGDGDQARAGGQEAERRGQVGRAIGGQEGDPLAGHDAVLDQERGNALHFTAEIRVGEAMSRAHIGHGRAARVSPRRRVDELGQIHGITLESPSGLRPLRPRPRWPDRCR